MLRSTLAAAILALLGLFCAPIRAAVTVGEIARLKDTGISVLQGNGLVMGLNGTGDSGKDPVLARQLLEYYKANGNPLGSIDELKNANTVAIVNVMCTIPEGGWKVDDCFDVTVVATHGAKSLEGGVLYVAPLRGPFNDPNPETNPVYAMAMGTVLIENPRSPRSGRVRLGAHMMRPMPREPQIAGEFTLVLNKPYAGYGAASAVADAITQEYLGRPGRSAGGAPPIATALDDRTVKVVAPEYERSNIAGFIGDVLATRINISLLKLPARVIYNQQSGKIVLTADVEISPVAITSADLTISTTIPPPTPTPDNPLVETKRWASIAPGAKESERAKLADLLAAFNQLNIPVSDQIALLEMMAKAGKLQAELVID
jgi:flagellar P-ring protein precursor FlgI